MNLKPDIDFSKLLETGLMSLQDLQPYFGRLPTKIEIDYARTLAMHKHPHISSTVRAYQSSGLRIMKPDEALAFQRSQVKSRISGLGTTIDRFKGVPVAELPSETVKVHDSESRTLNTLYTHLTTTKKALPGVGER